MAEQVRATRLTNLKLLRDERFEGSAVRLAHAIKRSPSQVSQWFTGVRTISEESARHIVAMLGLPTLWLDIPRNDVVYSRNALDDRHQEGVREPPHAPYRGIGERLIPVVGCAQLGDNGHFVELEYPVGHGDGYIDLPSSDPNAYAVRCTGDSMTPRIRNGEFVVIEPNHEVRNGDEVLVKASDGRVMVKQFLYRRDGRVHLLSVNEAHPPMALDDDQVNAMHFVSAIVKAARWVAG